MGTPIRAQRIAQFAPRVLAMEALVFVAAVAYYELGNLLLRADFEPAYRNAVALWDLEVQSGFFVEPWFQSAVSRAPPLLWLLVFFYVGPHFVLTIGFLGWAYWHRFPSYPHVRDSFLAFTFLAFGFQWLYPLAPPRLVPEAGLADTLQQTLPVNGSTPWIMALTNPYAALPSVHFGWALLVALLAVRLTRGRLRWAWYAYPGAIALSVLATGNHWLFDLALSVVFLGLTEVALTLRARHWTLASSAPARPVPTPVAELDPDVEGA